MADKEIRVCKQIVWRLNDMTKKKIEAYKTTEGLESASTKIMIGDNVTEWFLRVYFAGESDGKRDSVALFLCLKKSGSKSFNIKFTLGISCKDRNKERKFEWPGESFDYGNGYGTPALLTRANFLNPDLGYLIDGKVKFYCKLTITAKEAAGSDKTISLNQNQLSLKKMMGDENFADFEIETTEKIKEKKVLKAHKCVLAFGSPFFYGMLTTKMKEKGSNIVKVPEDSIVMKEVLRYIYSNEVENLGAIACELVFAAEKYQLDGLKQMCIASIIKTLTPKNVLQTLLAADRLPNSGELKSKCIELIVSNFDFLNPSEELKKLPSSVFLEIINHTIYENSTIYV